MAGSVQIRDIPDDVRQGLKDRATARGESLNQYLLNLLIEDAERPIEQSGPARRRAVSSVEVTRADRDSTS